MPLNRGLGIVYIAAATVICGISIGLRLSVPIEVAHYVDNGLTLPIFRYGLLFALIACGVVLSGERRPIALISHLAVLVTAVCFGLQKVEAIVVTYQPLLQLIIGYPVVTMAMGMTTGCALLVPPRIRIWLFPIVAAYCGLGLGVFVVLESPLDTYYGWFSLAGGIGGVAVVIASIAVTDGARRVFTKSSFAVTERILGSWLVAASLLLAALTIALQRPLDSEQLPAAGPNNVDVSQRP